jgi:hypothetical protein
MQAQQPAEGSRHLHSRSRLRQLRRRRCCHGRLQLPSKRQRSTLNVLPALNQTQTRRRRSRVSRQQQRQRQRPQHRQRPPNWHCKQT